MTLIFNDQGLKDVSPPCVAQTFVPHGARLFKLYVLGDAFAVVERPSLKNFKAGGKQCLLTGFFFLPKSFSNVIF